MTTTIPADLVEPRAGLVVAAQAAAVARRTGPLARATRRVGLALSLKAHRLRRVEAATLRSPRVRRFIAISQLMRQQLLAAGVPDTRITVIPNGAVMPTATPPGPDAVAATRAHHHSPSNALVCLFPANDPWRKGGPVLLNALARLAQQAGSTRPIILWSAGRWPQRLADQARRLGLNAQVRVLGQCDPMHPLYAAADVTVLPSFYDPSSKVVIESLMMGTPVITTRMNGASDFLDAASQTPRGIVLDDPADVTALAQAIEQMSDPARHQAMTHAIAAMDPYLLTMERHTDQLLALIDQLTASPPD